MTCSQNRSILVTLPLLLLILETSPPVKCQTALSLAETKHSCMALKAEFGEGCVCKQTKRYGQPECCLNNTRIQTVILKSNGLRTMPSLRMTDAHHVLVDRIDLSGNKIKFIGDSKVRNVKARTVVLSENNLLEISGYAFTESQFLKLKLNNNKNLRSISVDAFKNMVGLQTLDLSHTSISTLPINGLKKLKTLVLTNVPTLKSLPSVLSFTDLETAHFTYPHHCCLFKYVDDVTLNANGKYQRNAKEIHKRICDKKEQQKIARIRRKKETTGVDFLQMLLREWSDNTTYSGPEEHDDDELPPFTEISAEPCQSIGEEVQRYYSNITCYPQPDALNPCGNIVGYPFLRIAIWFVCLAAILGNITVWVLLGIVYEKRMRMHYLYMINMSVADMVTGNVTRQTPIQKRMKPNEEDDQNLWK
uniref:Uncharacterized protein n=1 Tax=Caenorhabditis japonica TaxID=281687 RepID=A0A8R1E663_CAEJA